MLISLPIHIKNIIFVVIEFLQADQKEGTPWLLFVLPV